MVSPGTGWSGVNVLCLGEIKRLICDFFFNVAADAVVEGGRFVMTVCYGWSVRQPATQTQQAQ